MKNSSSSSKYGGKGLGHFPSYSEEKNRLTERAYLAGLSMSEYLHRREFGGRPLVAQTDLVMVREVRRIGGLLKHNFETLRQGNAEPELLKVQQEALRKFIRAIEKIAAPK